MGLAASRRKRTPCARGRHAAAAPWARLYVKHLAVAGNLVVASKTYTPADVQADIQAILDTENAAEVARGAFHGAVAEVRATRARVAALVHAVKQHALIRFADQPEVLAEFGLEAPKPRRKRTVEEKLAAVKAQGRTRAARHTMGPRQRAKVKGTAPAAPATAPPLTPPTGPGPNGHG
jgi:hypothetical protein